MSSDQNHNNHMIHLGNYEEYFILYMDNELSDEQMKMVDDFLAKHTDLQAEFQILLNTKLPEEEISFDKESIFSGSMKQSSIDENLFLYIDNELTDDEKKTVELELAKNKEYQQQYQWLLQARLDVKEKLVYPNKTELYRNTERVVFFKPWMRVAAAVLVIALSGGIYLMNSSPSKNSHIGTAENSGNAVKKEHGAPAQDPGRSIPGKIQETNDLAAQELIANRVRKEKKNVARPDLHLAQQKIKLDKKQTIDPAAANDDLIARNEGASPRLDRVNSVGSDANNNTVNTDKKLFLKEYVNNSHVTSFPEERTTSGNDAKGSIKGFLRKATRLIEKRTGFDPVNDNGELLIGAVAVKLK